ncbi:MAG: hypothetical protein CM1200mP38_6160 [Dehalococcoidia bacterium]|nr:MAG: hypothetical protein CM1200mP38_6160 [Dehalococcoidia bacterium]
MGPPELDIIPGTNAVISPPNGALRDGGLVWLDHFAEPSERFKLFLYFRTIPPKILINLTKMTQSTPQDIYMLC